MNVLIDYTLIYIIIIIFIIYMWIFRINFERELAFTTTIINVTVITDVVIIIFYYCYYKFIIAAHFKCADFALTLASLLSFIWVWIMRLCN